MEKIEIYFLERIKKVDPELYQKIKRISEITGISVTNHNFNAYNESYIMCDIQYTDYTNFTFNNSLYDVSYGLNILPVDFGTENVSYTLNISQNDVDNEVFNWITVQPLLIKSNLVEVELDSTTDISFEAIFKLMIYLHYYPIKW